MQYTKPYLKSLKVVLRILEGSVDGSFSDRDKVLGGRGCITRGGCVRVVNEKFTPPFEEKED